MEAGADMLALVEEKSVLSTLTVLAPEPPPTQRVPLAAIPGGGTAPSAINDDAL